jgi:hypothetical protein
MLTLDPAVPFADEGLYAYWDGEGDETADRTVVVGRTAIAAALAASADLRPEPVLSLRDRENWFVEGALVTASGGAAATFAASAQLDSAGRIDRCLTFRCPLVERPAGPAAAASGSGDGRAILERYFEHLIGGELAEACECFSEDCLYSHPPYAPGTPRVEFRGRDELLQGFRRTRGRRSSRPRIVCSLQRGADCFIEGVVDNDAGPKGSFVSSASLDGGGLIRRYVAFYTASRIPRR